MATKDRKAQLVKEFEAKVAEISKACTDGTNAEVEGKLAELTNIEKEYKALREKEVFASLADVHEALERHHFDTIGHKKLTNEGVMMGVEREDKIILIDLKKFCEYKSFDLAWYYEMQALNKRLTMRIASSLGVSAKELKEIDNSYAMDKLAQEIELGKTPTSDTQCVKHIQRVLDELSEGEGKVNGHDLAYVLSCYSKRNSKATLRVMCSKHTMLQTILTDVFHRVATGGVYGVDYKKTNPVAQAEKSEPATKKAEKEVVVDREVA